MDKYYPFSLGKTDKSMIKRKIDRDLEAMFINKEQQLPTDFRIDLSGINSNQNL